MRIVLAGIIGRYPWGGVTWCSLMYLLGLRKLGHEVWYLEDTCECNFDPELNAISTDPGYALRYIDTNLRPFGFGDRWCYVDYTGRHHGIDEARMRDICNSADLFLVLSGGCWVWRDHYRAIPRKAFIDSDPAFTQLAIENARVESDREGKKSWYVDFFEEYDTLFTFGAGIANGFSSVQSHLKWHHTWQPIDTSLWNPAALPLPPRRRFTTIMTWAVESFEDIGGNKDHEFLKIIDLPSRLGPDRAAAIELAVTRPPTLLRQKGWNCQDALPISRDLWRYHAYIASSAAEFSVAKETYVHTRSGWFSDRSECYLAAGRPVVLQDTGFSNVLPGGEGIVAWNTADEAIAALDEVESRYALHARRARELAMIYFRDTVVLQKLLDRVS